MLLFKCTRLRNTPLHLTVHNNHYEGIESIKLLVDAGALIRLKIMIKKHLMIEHIW